MDFGFDYAPLLRKAIGASAQPGYRDQQWLLDASRNFAHAG
ncbi:hypothetical protein [Novosphingobium sp.]|nr:hypothetical protein [Novosphingobium sp.]